MTPKASRSPAESSDEFEKQKAPQNQVRFASETEEIEPSEPPTSLPLRPQEDVQSPFDDTRLESVNELHSWAKSLHSESSQLQESRLRKFSFDPVSLPASRVRVLSLISVLQVNRLRRGCFGSAESAKTQTANCKSPLGRFP